MKWYNDMKKMFVYFISICFFGYLALLLFAYFFAEKLMFPTPKSTYEKIDGIKMLYVDDGRKIATLFFENKNSNICVIYSHGNGEDIGKIHELMQQYRDRLNVNVLTYDYCGYGISEGKMTEADLPKCADLMYDYAINTLGFKPENMFFAGYSLGSSPTAYLASKHADAKGALIVGGVARAVKTILPYDIVPWKILHVVDYVSQIKIPVLFFHGTKDRTVHIRNAYENLSVAKKARLVKFQDCGHYPLFESPLYWSELKKFLNEL